MGFKPREILFSSTTACNLACAHCDIKRSRTVLSKKSAQKFLSQCRSLGVKKVGFTGGEPFLAPGFLCGVANSAAEKGFTFNRIMTNAIWWPDEDRLKRSLVRLHDAGYDGDICASVDAFHLRHPKKLARFIETAVSVWRRPDVVSIACVAGAEDKKTENILKAIADSLGARLVGFNSGHPRIKGESIFIKILKVDLAPVGKASAIKNAWDGKWFKEDYCKGPGNVFFVLPDGSVKSCCGYATDSKTLTIGNIKRDSASDIMKNVRGNKFVSAIFNSGLTSLRKRLQGLGVRFPGKTSSHCYFCNYILTKVPRKILNKCLSALILAVLIASAAMAQELKTARDYGLIPTRVVRELAVPQGYHEGLMHDGKDIWLCNGEGGKVWVIDKTSGSVTSMIEPVASFTEALTRYSEGVYYTTEWYENKVYRVRIEGGRMVVEAEASVSPAHPAGVLWNGEKLFVVAWTRGFGTKFHILEMDDKMNVLKKIRITNIQEPDHLAWDGRNLWLTSWYTRRVYKIDIANWEVLGYFRSPVSKTTGITWDGKNLWLTGTYGDLYEIEIGN